MAIINKDKGFYKKLSSTFLPLYFLVFLVWTLVISLSFFLCSNSISKPEDIYSLLLHHISIYFVVIILSVPNIFVLLKQK
jgi:hypothetical protein